MNELITIRNEKAVTSSLQVAELFKKRHDHLLRSIESLQEDVPNFGDMFTESYVPDFYGRKRKLYYMNRDGFTVLVMGFTGKKAMQFKIRYINAFNQMEKRLKNDYPIPTTFSDALRLAANQQAMIEQNKPKVLFANAVETSDTSILVGELAKLISQNGVDIGASRLFEWLRSNGYLISGNRSDRNMPTQRSMNLKIFEIKERTYSNPDGSVRVTKTPKVTGKGQTYFVNKFLKEM